MQIAPPIKNGRKLQLPSGIRLGDKFVIILFLLPAFILFTLFLAYPIIKSIYFSFFDWAGFGPAIDFVKLDNFKRILTDPVFLKGVVKLPHPYRFSAFGSTAFLADPGNVGWQEFTRQGYIPNHLLLTLRTLRGDHRSDLVDPAESNAGAWLYQCRAYFNSRGGPRSLVGGPQPGDDRYFCGAHLEILRLAPTLIYGGSAKHSKRY